MLKDKSKDLLHLHFLVFLWGFTSILGSIIDLSAVGIVWYRMLIAFLIVGFYIFLRKKFFFKISKKHYVKIFLAGGFISLHWVAFFYAIKISGVSITLSIMASGAFIASIIEPFFFKRKILIKELFFGSLTLIGLLIIFRAEFDQLYGMLIAFLATILSVFFTIFNSKLVKSGVSPLSVTVYELLIGWVLLTMYILVGSDKFFNVIFINNYNDLILLLILGSVCTAYAHVGSVKVMKNLSPFSFMLVINLEPVYAIFLSVIFFGESELMTLQFYFGLSLILLSVFLDALDKRRNKINRLKLN